MTTVSANSPTADSVQPPPVRLSTTDKYWLLLAVAIPVAGLCLQVTDTSWVSPKGFSDASLPPLCGSRELFGIDCPFCGLTRSTIHLMHGEWSQSFATHRLGWLVLLVIVAQIPYRLLVPWKNRATNIRWRRAEAGMWIVLGVLLIVNRIWNIWA